MGAPLPRTYILPLRATTPVSVRSVVVCATVDHIPPESAQNAHADTKNTAKTKCEALSKVPFIIALLNFQSRYILGPREASKPREVDRKTTGRLSSLGISVKRYLDSSPQASLTKASKPHEPSAIACRSRDTV